MENKGFISSKIKLLFINMALLFVMSLGIYAQTARFEQKIQWQAEKNASEYKVEVVKNIPGAKAEFFETEESFIKLSLPAGLYRYRVYAMDFLGRESSVSEWTDFEILKAKVPVVKTTSEKIEMNAELGKKLSIPVEISSISEDSKVELVNEITKEVVGGNLVTEKLSGEVKASKAEFEKVSAGEWKLRITNPSGLVGNSEVVRLVEKQPEPEVETPAPKVPANEAAKAMLEKYPELSDDERRRRQSQADLKFIEAELARREAKKAKDEEKTAEQPVIAETEKESDSEEKTEKVKKPYKFKDMELGFGGGILFAPLENVITRDSSEQVLPFVMAKLSLLPVKTSGFKLGLDTTAKISYVEGKNTYYEVLYPFGIFEFNIVFQKNLWANKLFVSTKAGANVFILNRQFKYTDNSLRTNPEEKSYGYIGAQAGVGLHFVPLKVLTLDVGVDYDHIFMDENKTAFLCPYAGMGVRW